jgi:hypothetical protein
MSKLFWLVFVAFSIFVYAATDDFDAEAFYLL